MYRNINKKILRVVTMIVIIFIILFVVGMRDEATKINELE